MLLPQMRPRRPFVGLALAAVLGIVLADHFPAPLLLVVIAIPLAAVALIWRPRTAGCLAFVALAFFGLHTLALRENAARRIAQILAAGPRVVRAAGTVWSEPEPPQFWSRDITCFFRLKLDRIDVPGGAGGATLNVAWAGPIPRYGDRLELTGSARNLEPTRNPGQFDFTRHLQRQGIYSEIAVRHATDGRVIGHGGGWRVQAFANESRRWIQRQLARDLEDFPEITALIASMILGLRGDTPDDARELFQRTGTLHLFAVSGLNVAMLAGIILSVFRTLRIGTNTAVVLTIPILCFYALVTGLPASCVRATIMAALLLLAPLFDRRAVATNSICAAAFLILAWDTNQLFMPGFQFSFVLVLTIILLARRIERWLEPLGTPDPFLPRILWNRWQQAGAAAWQLAATTLGVTFAAWIGSLLFTAGYFHLFSPAAIGANLVAVPLAFAILALGVATLVFTPVWKAGAALLTNANWLVAKALLWCVHAFALIPGGHFYVEVPRSGRAPAAEITLLDLRDGAACHLRAGKNEWLIDCGSAVGYRTTVLPYLRSRGVNRLDGFILSHGDAHHIGSALTVLADFRPRAVFDSPLGDRSSSRAAVHRELVSQRRGKSIALRGEGIHVAPDAVMRVLFPPGGLRRSLADDKALVLRLECAGTRVLFMSDSGFSTEQWLLENEPDLRAEIIAKGEHARDFSGTAEFMARVQPQVVICGPPDLHADPAMLDEFASAAAARGVVTFRQDRAGAVRVELREGGEFEVRSFLGDQTFRSRAR